jgi:hypothetical protein
MMVGSSGLMGELSRQLSDTPSDRKSVGDLVQRLYQVSTKSPTLISDRRE